MTSMDGLCSFGSRWKECSATLSWHLIFCAGKLSDVMYVPPWAYRDLLARERPLACSAYEVSDGY